MTSEPLLATCWTSAGDVRPGLTPLQSPVDLRTRVAAVARAGYVGIGLELADLEVARDGLGYGALAALIADAGITTTEVEFIDDWFTTGERRQVSDQRRHALLGAAAALGASHIKIGGGRTDDEVSQDQLQDELAALGEQAREHGTRVAIEPGAFSRLRDLDEAVGLVRAVDHPQVGLLLDVWHLARTGYDYTRLRDVVPPQLLFAVELDDGSATHGPDLLADTFDNRLLCGTGDFEVRSFVEAVRSLGFNGPWGVENMSAAHRQLAVSQALTRARDAALSVLAPPIL